MPHVVVRGKVEGAESTVFGLSRTEFDAASGHGGLVAWGGRVGPDGQGFKHPPLFVITTLENLFGYRVLSSTMSTQESAIWTLHRHF